jgi:hypothetical protein
MSGCFQVHIEVKEDFSFIIINIVVILIHFNTQGIAGGTHKSGLLIAQTSNPTNRVLLMSFLCNTGIQLIDWRA